MSSKAYMLIASIILLLGNLLEPLRRRLLADASRAAPRIPGDLQASRIKNDGMLGLVGFFEDYVATGRVKADHTDLTPAERQCGAMLVDGLASVGGMAQQYRARAGIYPYCHALMQWLFLYSNDRYFNDDGNGLQKLLHDISIRNEEDTPLTGREAFQLQLELSHLHHVKVPPASGGRDVNPFGGRKESQNENNSRKRCARACWLECMCQTPCDPRYGSVTPDFFDKLVLVELAMPFGHFPGYTETDIRVELADLLIGKFAERGNPPPQFLFSDETLFPKYGDVEGLRDTVDLRSEMIGIYCPERERRIRYRDMVAGAWIPDGFLDNLQASLKSLKPAPSVVVNNDDGSSAEAIANAQRLANEENQYSFQRVLASNCVLDVVAESQIKRGKEGATDEERSAKAMFFDNIAFPTQNQSFNGAQRLKLNQGSDWTRSYVVNENAAAQFAVTAPRATITTELVVDTWDYWENNGGLQGLLEFLSILCPDGGLPMDLVQVQYLHASHLQHLDLSETKAARDCDTEHMTLESAWDNRCRNIDSVDPVLPCIGKCLCKPKCLPCLFKLEGKQGETYLDRCVMVHNLLGTFGRYPRRSRLEIEEAVVRKWRSAFRYQGEDVPAYLQERNNSFGERRAGETALAGWLCGDCGEGFITRAEAEHHGLICGNNGEDPPDDDAEVVDARVEKNYAEFDDENDAELLSLIRQFGWKKWKAKTAAFTTCKPANRMVIECRAKRGGFQAYCARVGVDHALLKQCNGRLRNCRCNVCGGSH